MPHQHQFDQKSHHTQSPTLHYSRCPHDQTKKVCSMKASGHHLMKKYHRHIFSQVFTKFYNIWHLYICIWSYLSTLTSKTKQGNIFRMKTVLNTNSASWCTINQSCIKSRTGELIQPNSGGAWCSGKSSIGERDYYYWASPPNSIQNCKKKYLCIHVLNYTCIIDLQKGCCTLPWGGGERRIFVSKHNHNNTTN